MFDPFNLSRFTGVQAPVYEQVLRELQGRKTSHWMWFVFPQLTGLVVSPMAQRYAISGQPEARAYLEHSVLSTRLIECADLVLGANFASALDIFGSPDGMKLRSSMTLFDNASTGTNVFATVLDRFFAGKRDEKTLRRLDRQEQSSVPARVFSAEDQRARDIKVERLFDAIFDAHSSRTEAWSLMAFTAASFAGGAVLGNTAVFASSEALQTVCGLIALIRYTTGEKGQGTRSGDHESARSHGMCLASCEHAARSCSEVRLSCC